MTGRKPEIVCIGAQKAATSWFYRVCQDRTDIWVPPFKEVHFFDHKFCPENRTWIQPALVRSVERAAARHSANATRVRGRPVDKAYLAYLDSLLDTPAFNGTWYKRVFSRAPTSAKCLDVTPEYCTLPPEGVAFVAKFLRDSRFIYILRDPAARAASQLRMNLSRRKITPTTHADWMRHARDPVIANRGDYQTYIPRWRAHINPDKLLFLAYGDIRDRPAEVMRRVEAFAGLGREDPESLGQVFHKGAEMDIPEEVHAYFTDAFSDQRRFLEDTFGPDFATRL
ncbi:sulfotransferase [Tropicimonas sp. S265A]|uniref:sulfotransferase n=1 Tax=Tropicimonas sp. S265A TaxID=3415134 RepID=UPI003C7B8AD2